MRIFHMALFNWIESKWEVKEPAHEVPFLAKSHDELVEEAFYKLMNGDPKWLTDVAGKYEFKIFIRVMEDVLAKFALYIKLNYKKGKE